jgi:hypothetical protein
MTTIEDRTEFRAVDHIRNARAELGHRPPMPTVDELAGPILRGLVAVWDLGQSNDIDGFAFAVGEGALVDEAAAVLTLLDEVATAVEIGVAKFLRPDARAMHPENARALVMAVADLEGLRDAFHTAAHERMVWKN